MPDGPISERLLRSWIFLPSLVTIPDGPIRTMFSACSRVNCVLPAGWTMPEAPTTPARVGGRGTEGAAGVGMAAFNVACPCVN